MPGKDRDEDSGKYTTSYHDEEFLDAIKGLNGMAGTSEVANVVGCTHRTAYSRLKSIEEKGNVQSRKVGNSLVWSLTE